ncbi:branched chain amino acid aminotransferase [Geomonas sp. Red276]
MVQIVTEPLTGGKDRSKVAAGNELGFGKVFTDRMLFAEWREESGWGVAHIQPYQPLSVDPAGMVFHYGQAIFEGLKAYRWQDGRVALFRPEMNARRFNHSAERLCLPPVPEELFVEGIARLVELEREWIPTAPGTSLYIRPVLMGVEAALGIRPADRCWFYVVLSPVGAYYRNGFAPTSIRVEDRYVRAVAGGTGEAKTGANYASSLRAGLEAKEQGFDQVLWLDGRERRYIDEVGSMNMFFAYGETIVTAPLSGSILPGITRDSVLTLARELGYRAEERPIEVGELMADIEAGRVTEAFGTGTAAVITPVGRLGYRDRTIAVGDGGVGRVTQRLYDTLTGIQGGVVADPFGWLRFVGR